MMKSIITTILSIIIAIGHSFAQDLITKKNGDIIEAKVQEVNTSDVKFKRFDNIYGPTYSMSKLEIVSILYENGTKDVFDAQQTVQMIRSTVFVDPEVAKKATRDARLNYTGTNSGAIGTAAATAVTGVVFGLIPAIACSSSPPLDKNLNYQDASAMQDSVYKTAYVKEAHKIKKTKIWTHYGIGAGVRLFVFFAVITGTLAAIQ